MLNSQERANHRLLPAGLSVTRHVLYAENLQRENKDLNNKLKTTRVASAISEGNGSYEAKMRINQLVREIDKCIALLNN